MQRAIKQHAIIRDWQHFCARLAKLLKCEALDTEVEKAVKRLVRRARAGRKEDGRE